MAWEIASETPSSQWEVASEKPEQAPVSWSDTAKDVAQSAGTGVVKGVTNLAGISGDARELLAKGASKVAGIAGYDVPTENISSAIKRLPVVGPIMGGPTSETTNKVMQQATGDFYKPQTTAGEYAQTIGEFLPNAAAGPGGIARRVGLGVVAPALASEAAGQVTKGTEAEPYARAIGAVGAAPLVSRAISPLRTPAGRQGMIQNLEAEGIDAMTAGQRTGNKPLQYAESVFGDYPGAGQGATTAQRAANEQFTQAVLRRVGVQGPPTRANLDQHIDNLSTGFETLSARNTLRMDQQFANDITRVVQRYGRKLPSQQREVINNLITDLTTYGGQVPGDVYQIARSDISRMARGVRNNDPTYADALRGIRDSLDNAMGRSISPQDRQLWAQLRDRWGAWRTIENAAKNTDDLGNIIITPAALKEAASAKDRGQFARGLGRFAQLAQSGTPVLKTLPQSGTQPRAMLNTALASIGAGAAGSGMWPVAAAIGAPAVVGRAIMSRPAQRYLANQVIQGPSQSRQNALLKAYLATQGVEE